MKYGILKRIARIKSFFQQKIDRKVIVFLFFLLISTFFWLLNALSKEYTTGIGFPIRYSNFPRDKVLVGELPGRLSVQLKAYGFTLLKYKIKPALPPIKIDLRSVTFYNPPDENISANYYILTRYEVDNIDRQLSNEIEVIGISPDTIYFEFVDVVEKIVPVKADLEIDFEKQYLQHGALIIEPDSLTLVGPKTMLDTIDFVTTKHKKFEEVNDTLNLEMDLLSVQNLRFSENEVAVVVPVEKYTESKMSIPIQILNLPDTLNMTIFPKELKLTYMVALSDYDKVKDFMFRAYVDYNTMDASFSNKLKIELDKKPDFVKNIKQHPLNADFIIEK